MKKKRVTIQFIVDVDYTLSTQESQDQNQKFMWYEFSNMTNSIVGHLYLSKYDFDVVSDELKIEAL